MQKWRRMAFALVASITAMTLASAPAVSGPQDPQDPAQVNDARNAYKDWLEYERMISVERNEWARAKDVLHQRIDLLKREIELRRESIEALRKTVSETDARYSELEKENERRQELSNSLKETILDLETRTKTLVERLPDTLKSKVDLISQSIPEDPEETKLSNSVRFVTVIGVLNEVNKFQREITPSVEFRDLENGETSQITALYVGLGQAYYVSDNGQIAGYGYASPTGWVWTAANEHAKDIADSIKMHGDEIVAGFVQLPLEVR